ncbi:MAG TPA: rhodanese-like domain-containing protein [Pseudobacteroides sp.]|uniref:rhodanese-like domain-containing protein n=1 Tax=Pseudobacteroides sp. TaxID=1968840 RepID=UPI002F94AFD1
MKFLIISVILALALFVATSCGSDRAGSDNGMSKNTTPESAGNSIENRGYSNISPEEAKKRLDNEKGIILLDVRTREEYEEKHIPGSLLIPVDAIETEAPNKLTDKNAVIFVYCRSGRRSVTASEALVKMGYKNVYNLGGINDWPYETE